MRLKPAGWHLETFTCSIRGHATPGATVGRLRPEDDALGLELDDGRRLCRCLRCDVFVVTDPPGDDQPAASETLPPVDRLNLPRRGRALRDAVIIRIISVVRGLHSAGFALLAVALVALQANLSGVQGWARDLQDRLDPVLGEGGQGQSHALLSRKLHDVLNLSRSSVTALLALAIAYAVIEGVEAVGLWRERRWAEYLTVLATAGFLPIEIHELLKRVTVVRLVALVVNLALVVWLVWNKRLFGVRRREGPIDATDWSAILQPIPVPRALPEASAR